MGDDRKADYEMAPTSDPENPDPPAEKAELQTQDDDDDQQWSGLGKEELLRVANTPAWNWTRNILLILFWVAWVLMLVIAIILVVKAPSCPDLEWYQESSMYGVNVRSFQDSDGDGVGDLNGVKNRIAKIKEDFGAENVILSPIFKQAANTTLDANFGYNIVNFTDIDPALGTLDDFKSLIEQVQVNGMHIVLEFVPNHSSDQHEWFVESSKSRDNEYRDFYTWAPGSGSGPPNNWKNINGESAWTQLGEEYYYHFYESTQPDLNFRSANVTAKIKEAMNFWLSTYKVDGFVIVDADRLLEGPISTSVGRKRRQAVTDVTTMLTDMTTTMEPDMGGDPDMGEDPDMEGEVDPSSEPKPETTPGKADYIQYDTMGSDGGLSEAAQGVLDELYSILEENSYLGKYRVFIPQHSGDLEQNVLYQKEGWRGFPSSLSFANQIGDSTDSYMIKDHIMKLFDAKTKAGKSDLWDSWMIGHAGINRLATRASQSARALTMLLYTLPGTPMPFYGDELGLTDLSSGVSPQLAPYPWDSSSSGGFTTGNGTDPWQDVVENLAEVNAETQAATDGSFLNFVQNLTEYSSKPSIAAGSFNITSMNVKFFSYIRSFPEWPKFVVAINLNDVKVNDISVLEKKQMGKVVLSASGSMMGEMVDLSQLSVATNDAYLIELEECETCLF